MHVERGVRGRVAERQTFLHRVDQLLRGRLVDPIPLVGDLSFRSTRRRPLADLAAAIGRVRGRLTRPSDPAVTAMPTLLVLDWSGAEDELLIGRDEGCDVVLSDLCVSRRHARLRFRDGGGSFKTSIQPTARSSTASAWDAVSSGRATY